MSGRRSLVVALSLLAACAGGPWASPPPEPLPAPAEAPETPSGEVGAPRRPGPTPVLFHDSSRADPLRSDSAADARALEELANAHAPEAAPDAADPIDALAEGRAALTALDLETYATHDRVQYYLDFFQGRARDRMAVWLERLPRYEPMIRERFAREGLPADLIYLGLIESGYSNVAVSRSRAVGMWQFVLGTGRWMGLRVDAWVDERRDPVKATDAAARYLTYLTQRFGSSYLAAAAYNGGPGTVSRGLARVVPASATADQDGVGLDADEEEAVGWTDADFFTLADSRYLRRETKDYVPKLIAAALIARNPAAYGFERPSAVEPFPTDSIVVPDMTGLDVLAELAGMPVGDLRELNPHYLRSATPPGPAVVRLPAGSMGRVTEAYSTLPAEKRVRFREHLVRSGETLSGIAKRYRVSVADLRMANPVVRRTSLIRIGQRLIIPVAGGGSPASVATEGPRSAGSAATSHVVGRGETLSGIARRFGVSVDALQTWNGIENPRSLRVGQRLKLRGENAPAPAAGRAVRYHTVRRGETLSGLAGRYRVSVRALMALNGLSNPRQLQAGKRLRIPA